MLVSVLLVSSLAQQSKVLLVALVSLLVFNPLAPASVQQHQQLISLSQTAHLRLILVMVEQELPL
tara:strand:- start:1091 stop:1285 length:195 start_codon:yes stop_codon:yes gene_type:complete